MFNLIRLICPKLEASLPILDVTKLEGMKGADDARKKDGKTKPFDALFDVGRSDESEELADEEKGAVNGRKRKENLLQREDESPSPLHSLFVCILHVRVYSLLLSQLVLMELCIELCYRKSLLNEKGFLFRYIHLLFPSQIAPRNYRCYRNGNFCKGT